MIFKYSEEEFKVICKGIYRPPSDVNSLDFFLTPGYIYSRYFNDIYFT